MLFFNGVSCQRLLTIAFLGFLICTSSPAQWPSQIDLDDIGVSQSGARIQGNAPNMELGELPSGVGDFNGDGIADFFLGRDALILSGENPLSGLISVSALPPGSRQRIVSTSNTSFSGVGDLDGDGLFEIALSHMDADVNGILLCGLINLVPGDTDGFGADASITLSPNSTSEGIRIKGPNTYATIGDGMTGAGDVNGDGFGDFIHGAGYATNEWGAFVHFGRNPLVSGPGSLWDITALDATEVVHLAGRSVDLTGTDLSGVGDTNGDGFDDVLVSHAQASPHGRAWAGACSLVYGTSLGLGSGGTLDIYSLDGTNGIFFEGADETDHTGWPLEAVGDVNGDGHSDFVMTFAPFTSKTPGHYLVHGSSEAFGSSGTFDLRDFAATHGELINGPGLVKGVGDINGDGLADIAIGTRSPHEGTSLFWGRSDGIGTGGSLDLTDPTSLPDSLVVNSDPNRENHGGVYGAAGDLNGDGISDLLISFRTSDVGGMVDAGEVFILHGQASSNTATSRAFIRSGDAPPRPIGVIGNGTHPIPFTRCWINYDGGTGPHERSASLETVTLTRSSSGAQNFFLPAALANVMWNLSTDRTGHSMAIVTLQWTRDEVSGLNPEHLRVFTAPSPSGPWSMSPRWQLDLDRRRIRAIVNGLSDSPTHIVLAATGERILDDIMDDLLEPAGATNHWDINGDGEIDAADLVLGVGVGLPE